MVKDKNEVKNYVVQRRKAGVAIYLLLKRKDRLYEEMLLDTFSLVLTIPDVSHHFFLHCLKNKINSLTLTPYECFDERDQCTQVCSHCSSSLAPLLRYPTLTVYSPLEYPFPTFFKEFDGFLILNNLLPLIHHTWRL